MKRIRRAVEIFKRLSYGGWSWWIRLDKGGEHTILADRGAYYLRGWRLWFKKVRVAWLLAFWYLVSQDGLFSILKEEKKELVLHKISYL